MNRRRLALVSTIGVARADCRSAPCSTIISVRDIERSRRLRSRRSSVRRRSGQPAPPFRSRRRPTGSSILRRTHEAGLSRSLRDVVSALPARNRRHRPALSTSIASASTSSAYREARRRWTARRPRRKLDVLDWARRFNVQLSGRVRSAAQRRQPLPAGRFPDDRHHRARQESRLSQQRRALVSTISPQRSTRCCASVLIVGREGVVRRRHERRSDLENDLLMRAERDRVRSPSYLRAVDVGGYRSLDTRDVVARAAATPQMSKSIPSV